MSIIHRDGVFHQNIMNFNKVLQKYSAAPHILNSLLGDQSCDKSVMFDMC